MEEQALSNRPNVVLSTDWDVPVNLPLPGEKSRGHFAGRLHELSSLTNEIIRRSNGAILVAGHRGVGKTSLVHKAVIDSQKQNSQIIAILINAAQLDTPTPSNPDGAEGKSVDPKTFIEHLIRRLFATTRSRKAISGDDDPASHGDRRDVKPSGIPEAVLRKVEDLYRKAVAQEFKLTQSLAIQDKASREQIREESLEQSVKVEQLIYWLLAIVASFIAFLIPARVIWLCNLLPLGVAAGGYAGTALIRSSLKRTTARSTSATAEELYQFDNKLGNLEFDLESVQRDLRDAGWKLVYVIDELDKLPEVKTKAILSMCKNFFTLSDAVFIFVGDEKSYDIGRENGTRMYDRPKEYTYFNSRYYLAPPTTTDLRRFLKEIVLSKTLSDDQFDALGFCLFFEAHNDYFDFLSAVRGRITSFSNDNPVIEVVGTGLGALDVQKARFERCITSLYEGKYMSRSPLRWRENAKLIGTLFSKAKELVENTSPRGISEPQSQPRHHNQLQAPPDPSEALIRDFYRLLRRVGAFTDSSQQPHLRDRNEQYQYIGGIPIDPPLELDARTEFEDEFMVSAATYLHRVVSIYNVWNKAFGKPLITVQQYEAESRLIMSQFQQWKWNPTGAISNFNQLYAQLKGDPPYDKTKDEIDAAAKSLQRELDAIYPQLPMIFANMLTQACASIPHVTRQFQGEPYLLKDAQALRQSLTNDRPHMVYAEKRERQVVLVCDLVEKFTSLARSKNIPEHVAVVCFVKFSTVPDMPGDFWFIRWDDLDQFVCDGSEVLRKCMEFLESA